MSDTDLLALADEVGVTVDWIDFDSRERRVELETIRAILDGLGHDTKSPADALAAFRARSAPTSDRRGRHGVTYCRPRPNAPA
jgi:4-alpha-glucanotransferase